MCYFYYITVFEQKLNHKTNWSILLDSWIFIINLFFFKSQFCTFIFFSYPQAGPGAVTQLDGPLDTSDDEDDDEEEDEEDDADDEDIDDKDDEETEDNDGGAEEVSIKLFFSVWLSFICD